MQTTRKLYCFGKPGNNPGLAKTTPEKWPTPGPAAQLQIIPSEVVLHPGESTGFRIRTLDAKGFTVEELKDQSKVTWTNFIPPTARVRANMKGAFDASGKLVAAKDNVASAGAFEATLGNSKGYIRGRVLPGLPIKQDFESFMLSETTTNSFEPATQFAYPPLPWIGARLNLKSEKKMATKLSLKPSTINFSSAVPFSSVNPA